nr:ribosomal protein S18-alanine N-acetyltransferase [Anaerolineae bacterium]
MVTEKLKLTVRRMVEEDIDRVVEMDRLSFPTPWSSRTYHHEINSDRSTMLVVELADPNSQVDDAHGQWRVRWPLRVRKQTNESRPVIVAYSGFWKIADEAHISTIAVHPDWRRRKLGELLIWLMVQQAIRQGAAMVTLEVRVSNHVAQNLYRKYGFEISGVRKGYYRDNGENAYLMTVTPLDQAYRRQLVKNGRKLGDLFQVKVYGLAQALQPGKRCGGPS